MLKAPHSNDITAEDIAENKSSGDAGIKLFKQYRGDDEIDLIMSFGTREEPLASDRLF